MGWFIITRISPCVIAPLQIWPTHLIVNHLTGHAFIKSPQCCMFDILFYSKFKCSESLLCNLFTRRSGWKQPCMKIKINKTQGAALVWECCFRYLWDNEMRSRRARLSNDAGVWKLLDQKTAQWFRILWDRKTAELRHSHYNVIYQEGTLPHTWLANTAHCIIIQ